MDTLSSTATLFSTCSGTCYNSGYPNNWMVEIPAAGSIGGVAASHTVTGTYPIFVNAIHKQFSLSSTS
jgi:hypothetical protein